MRVTSEITTACVNEKYPASVVQSKSLSMQESIHLYIQCFTEATKKYFATLKRRSLLQTITTNFQMRETTKT